MFLRALIIVLVSIHIAYMAFVIFGELLTVVGMVLRWQWIRNFWFRAIHLGCIVVVAAESLANLDCPLTVWQSDLEVAVGGKASETTFVEQILNSVMFPTLPVEYFTYVYVGFAALVVLTFVVAPPRLPWRRRAKPQPQPVTTS